MERVAVQSCDSYDNEVLANKLEQLSELLGGIENFVSPGQKVLLKVNLIMGKPPGAAVTTHPQLVKETAKIIQQAGGEVIIGDSPGGLFNQKSLKKVYQKSGMTDIAQELGIDLNYNTDSKKVEFPEGRVKKSFILGKYLTEADVIINMPKLKTHGMTMYTGAVKNLFGAIPGLLKGEYHLRMPRVDMFSEMLIDLAMLIKPTLNIMDAVTGMEGEGPSSGTPCDFNYILAGSSSMAVDIAGVFLMGINPLDRVPLLKKANNFDGLPATLEDITVVGDKLKAASDINIPVIEKESNLIDLHLPQPFGKLADFLLRPRPQFDYNKCVGCGDCVENCPVEAIEFDQNHNPGVELQECIRCFCCQELCQYEAVDIKRPLLGRLLFGR